MSYSPFFTGNAKRSERMGQYRAIQCDGYEKDFKGKSTAAGVDRGYLVVVDKQGKLYKASCLTTGADQQIALDRKYGGSKVVAHADREGDLKVIINAVGKINIDVAEERGIYPDVEHIERMTIGLKKKATRVNSAPKQGGKA